MSAINDIPELSIIIISYNTAQITKNCIESIVKSLKMENNFENNDLTFEIIVVDNASQDKSIEIIKELKSINKNIILIENSTNVGFAKANNQAVSYAKGQYILFLNSDILVLKDAIYKLLTYFKRNEKQYNFIGGKLLNKDNSIQPSCGRFYTLPVVFAALFLRGDYWGLTRSSPQKPKEVDWISGACVLTRKDYFLSLHGFDENIFMYMDEIDLFYRAKQNNMHILFFPENQFIHFGSASSKGKTYPIIQVYHGLLYFYQKHYSSCALFLLKIMLQCKALIALFIGKITNNKYLIKTYGEAYELTKKN